MKLSDTHAILCNLRSHLLMAITQALIVLKQIIRCRPTLVYYAAVRLWLHIAQPPQSYS